MDTSLNHLPESDVAKALDLVCSFSRKKSVETGIPRDVFYDAGIDGMIAASRKWDDAIGKKSGAAFSTFAYTYIARHILWAESVYYRNANNRKRVDVQPEMLERTHIKHPTGQWNLDKIRQEFSDRDWEFIESLATSRGATLARKRNVSRQAISDRKLRLVSKLRKNWTKYYQLP